MSTIERPITTGGIKISRSAVETLATQAALEVEGVYSLASIPVSKKEFWLKGKASKPISVRMVSDAATISIGIRIRGGYKIKRVAEQIQENVKSAVQSMTRITVSKVNIYIAGIDYINE